MRAWWASPRRDRPLKASTEMEEVVVEGIGDVVLDILRWWRCRLVCLGVDDRGVFSQFVLSYEFYRE